MTKSKRQFHNNNICFCLLVPNVWWTFNALEAEVHHHFLKLYYISNRYFLINNFILLINAHDWLKSN